MFQTHGVGDIAEVKHLRDVIEKHASTV